MSEGGRAYVLIDDGDVSRFGPALAWSTRQDAVALHVIVDGSPLAPGVVARRAACFASRPEVWAVDGREMVGADPGPAEEADGDARPPELDAVAELLAAHGLEVVWEHGVLRGEVLGLEVARTVADHLEVGVGRHDRLARMEMRPSESLSAALESAASAVRELRRAEAPVHPANTLARSRWLRSLLVAHPSVVGAERLRPVAPPVAWFTLPEVGPAPALGVAAPPGGPPGEGGDDEAAAGVGAEQAGGVAGPDDLVVVCSVGVDLDLVPTAADCRSIHAPGAELVLVVPEGDDLPVTRELAGALIRPATVVTVGRDWPSGL